MFESKWTQLAETAAAQNQMARQYDPSYGVGPDVLLGIRDFADVNKQIAYEPLVLEQCQRTGMAALVDDFAARRVLLNTVAKSNCNAECRRIIEALPGDPSLLQMVEACLKMGTTGGVDVCTAETVVLKDSAVHKIPLDAFGPLGDGLSAFLMGRSSTTIQGIIVHLGLLNADYMGRIYAMVSTSPPPLTIPEKTRIAQLVPFKSSVPRAESQVRGDGGFGSTGPPQVFWTDSLTKRCPEKICTLSLPGATPLEIHLRGILDTGPVGPGSFGAFYQTLEHPCVLHQKEVWEMEAVARPPKSEPSDGKHGDTAGWYAIIHHASSRMCQQLIMLSRQNGINGEFCRKACEIPEPVPMVHRIDPSIEVTVFVTTPDLHPTAVIGQWSDKWSDPLHVLEWVFLPHQPQKTATALFKLIARLIMKSQQQCFQLMGVDPAQIVLPVPREDFNWSLANSVSLQSALENFTGQITYHLPSHKLLQVAKSTQISLRHKHSQEPVQGPTVFTDGSGKTRKAILTWKDGSEWKVLEGHEDGSAQLIELKAAVMAFQKFSQQPINLVTDSAYVADIAQQLGHLVLKKVSNAALFHLLETLRCALQDRVHPYYVLHVQSHTNLPGFVAGGNTDVTQIAEFSRLKYVNVMVDRFSSAMWASAHAGEKTHDIIAHWRQAFAVLGIPSAIKTDNGPAYTSQKHQRQEQELRRQQECEQRWPKVTVSQRKKERGKEDKRAGEDEYFIVDGQKKIEKK
ncbi:hypothetical protein HGM15179_019557 [Zosterops borbonicus]|uniref:Uncharacterized protein n=1 Tax=Zosterops borbonicus TaxID=364589 RepID=A0A8K1D944_9PASS|nr:hypothetical protein HGM15179_019557 [Zosterops borbonicus]